MSVDPPQEAETILIYKEMSNCFDASPKESDLFGSTPAALESERVATLAPALTRHWLARLLKDPRASDAVAVSSTGSRHSWKKDSISSEHAHEVDRLESPAALSILICQSIPRCRAPVPA